MDCCASCELPVSTKRLPSYSNLAPGTPPSSSSARVHQHSHFYACGSLTQDGDTFTCSSQQQSDNSSCGGSSHVAQHDDDPDAPSPRSLSSTSVSSSTASLAPTSGPASSALASAAYGGTWQPESSEQGRPSLMLQRSATTHEGIGSVAGRTQPSTRAMRWGSRLFHSMQAARGGIAFEQLLASMADDWQAALGELKQQIRLPAMEH